MDALKKAERTKRGGRIEPAGGPPTEPGEPAPATGQMLSDLPADPVSGPMAPPDAAGEDKAIPGTEQDLPPKRRRSDAWAPAPGFLRSSPNPATDAPGRDAARNAFAAKQPAPNRTPVVAAGAVLLVAVAAIGIYFWLQFRPEPRPAMAGNAAVAPLANRPTSAPAAATPLPAPGRPTPVIEPPRSAAPPGPRTVEAPKPAARAETDSPIRITASRPVVNPALNDAYQAFQAGDLVRARAGYERLLQSDPRNTDALRGAAAVALREGRRADAQACYRRLVESDPRDAVAQAGLAGLEPGDDPLASESRLKTLLAGQPDAPALHFALGNLYARQGRWNEAQQAYFGAVSGDADNPDYLFNLAVSLDQIHQPRPAAQYYRQALAAAAARPAAFDPVQAAARLRELLP